VAFLEDAVRAAGGQNFKLAEVTFSTTMLALDTTVRRILGQVLSDLCEVAHLYDCDYLLDFRAAVPLAGGAGGDSG
jgi:hypothetical protein